jgi:hypothetical protein
MLSNGQLQAIKADISANPDLDSYPAGSDGSFAIAYAYNLPATPDFIVWKTLLHEQDIAGQVSAESTSWSWSAFITRSQGERDGWGRMFNGTYSVNPSLPNVRAAFVDIFSGAPGASQRTHLAAMSKRKASRIEKLLASGTGSLAVPATMGFEGNVTYQEIEQARNL